uniref:DUF577 domain-containing protein n=1 Tax=Hydatigena taeniaeformis TaxID=6205 RepID=A0A0R3XDI9_HYDTA
LYIVRVLGNLTRSADVRASIVATISPNLNDACLIDRFWSLLKTSDEIVYSTLGVIVNLMLESTFLAKFRERDGLRKMVDIMRTHAGTNWRTTALAGKVMCNFIDHVDCDPSAGKRRDERLGPEISAELHLLLYKLIDIP